ncbi:MAG: hypothetical protein OXG35_14485 [Acidobacteria bacterium]|nr:hypothetical protein [Acidobacteriota bacterium]
MDQHVGRAGEFQPDAYSFADITIAAGETEGTTLPTVTADDLPDGDTRTDVGEKLVLHGSVEGMKIGTLRRSRWRWGRCRRRCGRAARCR